MKTAIVKTIKNGFYTLVLLLPVSVFGQLKTYSFQQADSLLKVDSNRLLVVFIHTDWCKYCDMMLHTTFKDEEVIRMLNEHYVFVKFNAEYDKDIDFNGMVFKFRPSGNGTGIHELAEQLGTMNGKLAYPALCILNYPQEIIFQSNQFIPVDGLRKLLTQFSKQ